MELSDLYSKLVAVQSRLWTAATTLRNLDDENRILSDEPVSNAKSRAAVRNVVKMALDTLRTGVLPQDEIRIRQLTILTSFMSEDFVGMAKPPVNTEFLFYLFLDAQNCDSIVGDLEERYRLIHKKFGKRRADLWYWTQAIRSVGPIAWVWTKKAALKPVVGLIAWALAKRILGHDSCLAALVELYRKIRS